MLLKIENSRGHFRDRDGKFHTVDKLTKDHLLHLVDCVLAEDEVDLAPYDVDAIRNPADQIVYKSVFEKLSDLRQRRQEFVDESERLYLEHYERFSGALATDNPTSNDF